jgi:transcriptional antiterminator RfaH
MSVSGARWYLAQTQAHAEAKAAFNLGRQGFTTYLPRCLKRRRHARRVEVVAAPLFPRYVFVAIDMATQRWRLIHSTFGIAHLVCYGEEPAIVPDRVIADLQTRENPDGFIELHKPTFAVGDKVRVCHGVFESSFGLFEGMTGRERVAVLLDLVGRKVRVVMDAEAIEAA